ncbi:MAG: hypothetical protein JSS44_04790 [Proteobacteria bacterium]|nr:hypothetical protein [Pseudomonadota bacterium]MBS0464650.1 hypothetical protein [Pseudomonadota bacterium]
MGFPETQWSLILASGDAAVARAAWGELATRYRAPIHAWFRCRFGADRADDLTAAFLTASIADGWWARADADRGSFRTYLRVLLTRFGARHAQDLCSQGDADALEAIGDPDGGPEAAYERAFAQAVVGRALAALRVEAGDGDDGLWFLLLERGDPGAVGQLASRLGVSPNVVSQRLRRMKLRLRELLRAEFAALVAAPTAIDAELRCLRGVLEGR